MSGNYAVLQILVFVRFYMPPQNCAKRQSASSYLFACASAWNNLAAIRRIFVKFDIVCFENMSGKFKFS